MRFWTLAEGACRKAPLRAVYACTLNSSGMQAGVITLLPSSMMDPGAA